MAACLISVNGTSGVIRINYTINGIPYTIKTSTGNFYIEDTATDVTYTTLTGDLTASSECFTITELFFNCYKINWTGLTTPDYKINEILLGSYSAILPNISFPNSGFSLIDSINNLGIDSIKIVGYKIDTPLWTDSINYNYNYIFKVVGNDVPIIKIKNADTSGYIYIHGVPASCTLPIDYTPIEPYYSKITTTTTVAP